MVCTGYSGPLGDRVEALRFGINAIELGLDQRYGGSCLEVCERNSLFVREPPVCIAPRGHFLISYHHSSGCVDGYPVTAHPASARITSPVIGLDSSLNRNSAIRAMSSASTKPPFNGCLCAM